MLADDYLCDEATQRISEQAEVLETGLGTRDRRGRPKEPWRVWLKRDRVESVLREQLRRIALDRRVKVETRVRVSQYLLDHAHGRSKETVELDTPNPLTESLFKAREEMRAAPLAPTKSRTQYGAGIGRGRRSCRRFSSFLIPALAGRPIRSRRSSCAWPALLGPGSNGGGMPPHNG